MSLSFDLDDDPEHENLIPASACLIALELRETLASNLPSYSVTLDQRQIDDLAESLTFGLAMLFDTKHIAVNGRKYFPRLSFVDDQGHVLPGASEMDFMHECSASPLSELEELTVVAD